MRAGARAAAKAAGERFYFTGQPCKRGHVAQRYVSGFACVDCERTKDKADRAAYDAQRYRADPGAAKRRVASWCKRNPAMARANKARWQKANPGSERIKQSIRRARKASAGGEFTQSDVRDLLRIQRHECAACAVSLSVAFHIDHIIPVSRGGASWCGNLQLLCPSCNWSKADRLPIQWRVINSQMLEAA